MKIRKVLEVAWKWMLFIGWLIWFLFTFPWQLRNAYGRFLYATSPSQWKDDGSSYSGRYFEHFN